jgi:antitoxin YefM
MRAITYSNARKNLRALIQNVCKNAEPTIIVGSQDEEQAVLVSLDDFQAMEETAYLLGSPTNRAHLEKSLQEAKDGRFVEFSTEDL